MSHTYCLIPCVEHCPDEFYSQIDCMTNIWHVPSSSLNLGSERAVQNVSSSLCLARGKQAGALFGIKQRPLPVR